jgi:protein phosphatase 2C family protein 2/3
MLPNYEVTRYSERIHGVVKGFAVCTNQGLVRNYNEDRVSIVLNILKPSNKDLNDYWPNCSIFGAFDGHGGAKCAEFLRNHLHHFVKRSRNVLI